MFLNYLVPQGQYWHHYQQGKIHQWGTAEESKTVHHDEWPEQHWLHSIWVIQVRRRPKIHQKKECITHPVLTCYTEWDFGPISLILSFVGGITCRNRTEWRNFLSQSWLIGGKRRDLLLVIVPARHSIRSNDFCYRNTYCQVEAVKANSDSTDRHRPMQTFSPDDSKSTLILIPRHDKQRCDVFNWQKQAPTNGNRRWQQ